MTSLEEINTLLNIQLTKIHSNEMYDKILDILKWMDYYKNYDSETGFICDNKYYLPYFLDYEKHRCARVYYIYCGDNDDYDKYVSIRIYEGYESEFRIEGGIMSKELFIDGEYLAYDLLKYYIWKNEVAINFVKEMIKLTNCNQYYLKNKKNMNNLFLIFCLIYKKYYENKQSCVDHKYFLIYKDEEIETYINLKNDEYKIIDLNKDNEVSIWNYSIHQTFIIDDARECEDIWKDGFKLDLSRKLK